MGEPDLGRTHGPVVKIAGKTTSGEIAKRKEAIAPYLSGPTDATTFQLRSGDVCFTYKTNALNHIGIELEVFSVLNGIGKNTDTKLSMLSKLLYAGIAEKGTIEPCVPGDVTYRLVNLLRGGGPITRVNDSNENWNFGDFLVFDIATSIEHAKEMNAFTRTNGGVKDRFTAFLRPLKSSVFSNDILKMIYSTKNNTINQRDLQPYHDSAIELRKSIRNLVLLGFLIGRISPGLDPTASENDIFDQIKNDIYRALTTAGSSDVEWMKLFGILAGGNATNVKKVVSVLDNITFPEDGKYMLTTGRGRYSKDTQIALDTIQLSTSLMFKHITGAQQFVHERIVGYAITDTKAGGTGEIILASGGATYLK